MDKNEIEKKKKEFKEALDAINVKIDKVMIELNPLLEIRDKLKDSCEHVFGCEDCNDVDCKCGEALSAHCLICGKSSHIWYCPKSPDHVCHYDSRKDEADRLYVELYNGKRFYKLPEDHDPDNESDDWCIFCGYPDERK